MLDIPAYVVSASTMDSVVGFHLNRGVWRRGPWPGADLKTCWAVAAGRLLEGVNDQKIWRAVWNARRWN